MPVCRGVRIPLDISIGGTPVAKLAIDGLKSNFLLDTGATYSAIDALTLRIPAGTHITFSVFSLFKSTSVEFMAEDMSAFRAPAGGQQGRIGTDLLGQARIEFHYEVSPPFAVMGTAFCDPATLRNAGFVEIDLRGYSAANPSHIQPKNGIPNVPVIGMRIGTTVFPAQVDTGLDDEFQPRVVQANAALIAALRRACLSMHSVQGPPTLGCDRRWINEYWQVDGIPLTMITTDGKPIGVYPPPVLEVKADQTCGGISAFDVPFGQLGASWLLRWGTSVYDGPAGRVWIRR